MSMETSLEMPDTAVMTTTTHHCKENNGPPDTFDTTPSLPILPIIHDAATTRRLRVVHKDDPVDDDHAKDCGDDDDPCCEPSSSPPNSSSSLTTRTTATTNCSLRSSFVNNNNNNNRLYDREKQQARLIERFHAVIGNQVDQTQLVLIYGAAGTGKTALALSLRPHCWKAGGYFIRGKFNQPIQHQNHHHHDSVVANTTAKRSGSSSSSMISSCYYAPIVAAFTDLVEQMLVRIQDSENPGHELAELRQTICKATSGEAGLLTHMIPALVHLLGQQPDQTVVHGVEAMARVQRVFGKFVASICSPARPLVLFLDDLQWSNTESVDLLRALLKDSSIEGLLVVGACRGNDSMPVDDSDDSDLSVMLRSLQGSYDLQVTEISVSNLEKSAVTCLLADTFPLLAEADCHVLADLVFQVARGNMFDTIHLMESLEETGVVQHSSSSSKGTGARLDPEKMETIISRLGNDAAKLVSQRILRLSSSMQMLLMSAACLGCEFDQKTLQAAVSPRGRHECDETWEDDWNMAQELFLIVRRTGSTSSYSFVHDKVQLACYELIPLLERPRFHLKLGRSLWKALSGSSSDEEIKEQSGLIVEQLSHGLDLIDDGKERLAVAGLCLQAGRNAVAASCFSSAAALFAMGLELLPARHWRDQYRLSLNLSNAAAEAEHALGHFDRTDSLISDILMNGRTLHDKLSAYRSKIYSLGNRGRLQEAIETGLQVVELLDDPLPRKFLLAHILRSFQKTKRMLHGLTDADILSLPHMTDENHLFVMGILTIIAPYTYTGGPKYFPLVVMRIVQLTLQNGLSPMGAIGFASYGLLVANAFHQMDDGYRFGKLAVLLVDRFGLQQWLPRVYVTCYGSGLLTAEITCQEQVESLMYAHRIGLATGDMEISMQALHLADYTRVWTTEPLSLLYADAVSHKRLMISYGQDFALAFYQPFSQYVSNLRGESDNPLILTGAHLDECRFISDCKREKNHNLLRIFYLCKAAIAHLLNDYEGVETAVMEFRSYKSKLTSLMTLWLTSFMMGSASLSLASKNPRQHRRQRIREARRCLRILKSDAVSAPRALLHRVYFLEAKFHLSVDKNIEKGLAKFEVAGGFAAQSGILQDQASALEHAGMAMIDHGRKEEGCQSLRDAKDLYEKWGAIVKVAQLDRLLAQKKP